MKCESIWSDWIHTSNKLKSNKNQYLKKKIMVYCLKTQTTVQYSWYIINFIIIISKEKLRFIQAASSCIDNLIHKKF